MSGRAPLRNPFGILLVVGAMLFAVSAWCYHLATLRALQAVDVSEPMTSASPLMSFFRDRGTVLLLIELVALAVCVVALLMHERRPR